MKTDIFGIAQQDPDDTESEDALGLFAEIATSRLRELEGGDVRLTLHLVLDGVFIVSSFPARMSDDGRLVREVWFVTLQGTLDREAVTEILEAAGDLEQSVAGQAVHQPERLMVVTFFVPENCHCYSHPFVSSVAPVSLLPLSVPEKIRSGLRRVHITRLSQFLSGWTRDTSRDTKHFFTSTSALCRWLRDLSPTDLPWERPGAW